MGDVDDAVTDGEGALAKAESAGLVSARIEALHALGHVRLSLGDAASANVHLARAWEILRRAGFGDPGTFPFVPDHVEALVEIGAGPTPSPSSIGSRSGAARSSARTPRQPGLGAGHCCEPRAATSTEGSRRSTRP